VFIDKIINKVFLYTYLYYYLTFIICFHLASSTHLCANQASSTHLCANQFFFLVFLLLVLILNHIMNTLKISS